MTDESNLVAHARTELAIIGEEQETVDGILRIIQAFADMGHSGGSASVVIPWINMLLQYQNLTPLTTDPTEWENVSEMSGEPMWQNKRNPEAFSKNGGETYYRLSTGKDLIYNSQRKIKL